ncbi:flagellar type III secretion system protein FliR [Gracilibacillus caseinilyticus]|uniref:Flagellar biosynthetic protein FliR n=1 Tax=Gracilibacillus caseinilyticus TaxID=2932256 RepID=A0ABY4EVI5_9BACI|nr:flagellar biosynthetic protein FliR [Gracilibacillus caseinilyticus]UOQ47862.1 flagellar type III secretion system protein FliR [Gracilibacillus caseinilyticus]
MFELIDINRFPAFILILVRVLTFLSTVPIFSYRNIPTQFKIGMGFFIAWMMFYTLDIPDLSFDGIFLLLVMKEAVVGLLMGLLAYIIMAAIQIAGGFIDFQMGFAIANVVDPQTGAQSPLIGQYFYTIAILFLLTVDGHHLLLSGLMYSYEELPLDQMMQFSNIDLILQTFSKMFLMAFQLALPIVGCLFLVDVALGIIARTVPQLNVFVVGLPLKILVSFAVLFVFIPFYIAICKQLFQFTLQAMQSLIQMFGGA